MASRTGHCLCGAVGYRLAEAPKSYGACHCAMCRRWTGGIEMGVQTTDGAISWEGTEHLRTYASSDWAERGFCEVCGSSLFWRLTAEGPMRGMVSLSVGSLDDMAGLSFDAEVFVDHRPESHEFAGERHRMTEAEVMAAAGLT